ncbi:GIY-YIG nuclease family protein [Desulfosporosinus nitroreducens]|uniref:GIY-YIG nuclease family protein n=1 Tax=Desulfosporosinus nitroreducens TaxID=2018668 RepID=UPI00207D1ADF|nr:GIY-YIG nuclease family protein [Desulfosporosinus nitroreducens]MCO1604545.1 GIY-YIG nuclease family protein [Desulfosporosinus nitroreducens]
MDEKTASKKHYLDVIDRIIYVLELEDGCFYIGQTQKKSFERRMKEHFDTERKSRKSAWVREHKAVKVLETSEFNGTVPEGEVLEEQKTLQYMRKYGVDRVRGGYYCVANYNEILKCLKAHGHIVIDNALM